MPLESGRLVALARHTGVSEWSADVQTAWPPLVSGDLVLVAGRASVDAFRPATGLRVWSTPLGSDVRAPLAYAVDRVLALVNGELVALQMTDGRRLWSTPTVSLPDPASLSIDVNDVWVSQGSRVTSLALDDGRLRWTRELSGTLSPPVAANGRVVVGSTDNHLYALDGDTGAVAWRWRYGGDVVGAAADSGRVYVAARDNLLRGLRDRSGNQIWKRTLATRPLAPPLVVDGTLFVAGHAPSLSTFDATSGEPLGTYTAPGVLLGAPLVDRAPRPFAVSLVVVTRDGRVVGLRPTSMLFREPPHTPLAELPGQALTSDPPPG